MTSTVTLCDVSVDDLETLFQQQLEPEALQMAAFAARDREAFMTHWRDRVMGDPSGTKQSIVVDNQIAGYVVCYASEGKHFLGYWLGKRFWGRGIGSQAVAILLSTQSVRPIYAEVAAHNAASIRILTKFGFIRSSSYTETSPDGEVSEIWTMVLPTASLTTFPIYPQGG